MLIATDVSPLRFVDNTSNISAFHFFCPSLLNYLHSILTILAVSTSSFSACPTKSCLDSPITSVSTSLDTIRVDTRRRPTCQLPMSCA